MSARNTLAGKAQRRTTKTGRQILPVVAKIADCSVCERPRVIVDIEKSTCQRCWTTFENDGAVPPAGFATPRPWAVTR